MDPRRAAIDRFSAFNRERKYRYLRDLITRLHAESILLVGVSWWDDRSLENAIEKRLLGAAGRVVASGLGDDCSGWPEYVQADALDLPFADGEFDLVFSNAVIEHVGAQPEQRRFVEEHDRVGRNWVITSPNRLFPVEAHTGTLFRHMTPGWRDGAGWVTRLLSPSDLRELLPARARIRGSVLSPTLMAVGTRP
jgi:hypothetical protein